MSQGLLAFLCKQKRNQTTSCETQRAPALREFMKSLGSILDTVVYKPYESLYHLMKPSYGTFRKLGVPCFGVLKIRILLFRVLY